MKIKKIKSEGLYIYPATIAAAVKDANFLKEDDSPMTLGEINLYLNSKEANLSAETKQEFKDELQLFVKDNIHQDLTDEKHIIIDKPKLIVKCNLIIEKYPETKDDNLTGEIEFLDEYGHYFKKPISGIGCQGSMSYVRHFCKQSFKFDMSDCDIKFGNWPIQDSFHMKAWFIDGLRGKGIVVYRVMTDINDSMGYHKARPWRRLYNNDDYTTGSGDEYNDYDTEGTGVPDGFPVALYVNDEFYGVFTWALKKDRAVYHQKKNNPLEIHLDSTDTNWESFIFNNTGAIAWNKMIIRNPNNLLTTAQAILYVDVTATLNTTDPDAEGYVDPESMFKIASADAGGLNPSEWTQDHITNVIIPQGFNDNPYVWYLTSKGKTKYFHKESAYIPYDKDYPSEILGDPSVDEYTATVKNTIQRLADFTKTYATKTNNNDRKALFEEYFDPDWMIDYLLVADFTMLSDCMHRNTQWCTWDGIKWYPLMYDTDTAFGCHWLAPKIYNNASSNVDRYRKAVYGYSDYASPWSYLTNLYMPEIKQRYAELVDKGFLTVEYWNDKLNEWVSSIGYDYYKKEFKKWPQTPGYRDPLTNKEYWMYRGDNNRVRNEDGTYSFTKISNVAVYNPNKTYVPGDVVFMADFGSTSSNDYEGLSTYFECIKECTGESPVTGSYDDTLILDKRFYGDSYELQATAELYNSGMKYGGYFESIQRIINFLERRKQFCDTIYEYQSVDQLIINGLNDLKGD